MAETSRQRGGRDLPGRWGERYAGLDVFDVPGWNVYAVLDGASAEGLPARLREHKPECYCLYRQELTPDMAEVAPYLVRLEPGDPLADWVFGEGWGNHWGILAASAATGRAMRQHFRQFVMVQGPEGKPLYFRFYDPRVLRAFLPTCNGAELAELFGPVACYVMEGEDPNTVLRFELDDGALTRHESPRSP